MLKTLKPYLIIGLFSLLAFTIWYLHLDIDEKSKYVISNTGQNHEADVNERSREKQISYYIDNEDNTESLQLAGFDIAHARFKFLPNFKSPCWYERVGGENIYAKNLLLTENYPFKTQTVAKLHNLPQEGITIQAGNDLCGKAGKCRLRCLPYFMIIGVAKSGTLDLAQRINLHPQLSSMREIFYWNQFRYKDKMVGAPLGDYADLFDPYLYNFVLQSGDYLKGLDANFSFTLGEYSSMTIYDFPYWSEDPRNYGLKEPMFLTPHDVYEVNPRVRLIAIMRNPTTRLYSQYNMKVKDQATPEDFHMRVQGSIHWWEVCTSVKGLSRRYCAYGSPPEMPSMYTTIGDHTQVWNKNYNYSGEIRNGIYAISVREWLNVFPMNNILFLKMEEYSSDLFDTFNSHICPFLGVDKFDISLKEQVASVESVGHKRHYEPMLPETKELLDNFYRPFNEELATMLGHRKWLWQD